jgi:hypothetical protein
VQPGKRQRGLQAQREVGRPGRAQPQRVGLLLDFRAPVHVDGDREPDAALEHPHVAEQLAARRRQVLVEVGAAAEGQGIAYADGAGPSTQLGDEHAAVVLVELARLHDLLGSKHKGAATLRIQHTREQRLAVEARRAEPRDGAVATDQRSRSAVSDQSVVLDWRVAIDHGQRREGLHVDSPFHSSRYAPAAAS